MRRALAAALLGALLLSPTTASGRSRAQTGPVRISVRAGHEGLFVPGTWSPVAVQLEASRALRGELQVTQTTPSGFRAVRAMAVEVPAGGLKEYDLLVPPFAESSSSLAVSLVEGETTLATRRTELAAAEDSLLVGVLAEALPDGLDGVVSPISGETVQAVPLTDRMLALGPWALDGLAYVVADAERLATLPPDAQEAAADWVALGGRLVVTDLDMTRGGWNELAPALEAPGDLGPQPEAPTVLGGRASVRRAGLGELIGVKTPLQSLHLGASGWAELLRPVPRTKSGSEGDFFGDDPSLDPDLNVARSLRGSIDADPRLGWLIAFLAAYLVLVGPVNYVVLKRLRRRELAWVTVPGLALLFSAAGFGLVRGTDDGLDVQSAGIVFASSQGGSGRVVVTASSGRTGSNALGFESQATGASTLDSGPESTSITRLTSDGSEVLLEASPFAVTVAHGAIESFRGHLEARLSWHGAATPNPAYSVEAVAAEGGLEIDVQARDPIPDGVQGVARVVAPDGTTTKVDLARDGVDSFSVSAPADAPGAYLASVDLKNGGAGVYRDAVGAVRSYSTEYLPGPVDESLLKELSRSTDGRFGISPQASFDPDLPGSSRRVELFTPLLLVALLLLPVDIALRRVLVGREDMRAALMWRPGRRAAVEAPRNDGVGRLLGAAGRSRAKSRARPDAQPRPAPPKAEGAAPAAAEPPAAEPPTDDKSESTVSALLDRKRRRH